MSSLGPSSDTPEIRGSPRTGFCVLLSSRERGMSPTPCTPHCLPACHLEFQWTGTALKPPTSSGDLQGSSPCPPTTSICGPSVLLTPRSPPRPATDAPTEPLRGPPFLPPPPMGLMMASLPSCCPGHSGWTQNLSPGPSPSGDPGVLPGLSPQAPPPPGCRAGVSLFPVSV